MRSEKEILDQFTNWAENQEWVRAAVLTSSRCDPKAKTDFLSDYDIEMYVSDIDIILENDDWTKPLGRIMVRWPLKAQTTFSDNWVTRGIIFSDGLRIDFQITDKRDLPPSYYDYGCRVLVDKENISKIIPQPRYSMFNVKKPSQNEYDIITQEFFWNATYVPKYLKRQELPFAKMMLGQAIHDKYLHNIISWYIGMQHGWSVNVGVAGKHFKNFLDPETWLEYESTFAGAGIEENWKAFFNSLALFSRLGRAVADTLAYQYPLEMEAEMMAFYRMIYEA